MKNILLTFFLVSSISIVAKSNDVTNEVIAIYKNATVYTGYTLYLFKDTKTGKDVEVSATSEFIDADLAKKIVVPKNLLEDPKNIEGLPGANPKLVGKKFKIQYLKNERIIITRAK